jgi:hypothetical protein
MAVLATAAIAATPAFAGSDTWDGVSGNGADNLPCADGGFWVLSPGADVGTATLTVNGVVVGNMVQAGGGDSAYQLESSGALDENSTASVSWTGSSTAAFLKLSHCAEGTTTGQTTGETTGETTGATTGETTGETTGATTGETTAGTTAGTTGSTTGTGGVSGSTTGGTTGGTAGTPSGGNLPFTGLPVWMPLLAAAAMLGSGIFLVRRRKGEIA